MSSLPPPSWFPDPNNASQVRWWDGARWTEHTMPYPDGAPTAPAVKVVPVATAPATEQDLFAGLDAAPELTADAPETAAPTLLGEPRPSLQSLQPFETSPPAERVSTPLVVTESPAGGRSNLGRWLLVAGLAVLAVGIGVYFWSSRDNGSSNVTTATTTRPASTTSRPVPATALPTTAPSPQPTTAPTTGAPPTSSATTTRPPATTPPPPGAKFVDPNGSYQWVVPPAWETTTSGPARVWFTGKSSPQFRDNVNVLSERLTTDMTAADYLKLSVSNAPKLLPSFSELSRTTFDVNGRQVAQIDYRSNQAGLNLRHRALMVVKGRNAITITYTTQPERFDAEIGAVQPFLATIEAL